MIEITEIFFGRPIAQEAQVSFSLSYHDWCELKKTDAWQRVEEFLEHH